MKLADRASKVFEWAFLLGVVALSLQWFPQIGFSGVQLSDFLFLFAVLAMAFSGTRLIRLPGPDLVWLGLFIGGTVLFVKAEHDVARPRRVF